MTKSFTVLMTGRTGQPHGVGPRMIEGATTLSLRQEALHAKDVGMHSLYSILVTNTKLGTVICTTIRNPGTVNNFASFTAYRATCASKITGTWGIRGSQTFRILAIGE